MDLNTLLRLLEERLDQHDNSRREIQSQLDDICSDELSLADSLEEEIAREIRGEFDKTEERILGILNKLSSTATNESGELDVLMEKARGELASEQRYEINHNKWEESFSSSYSLIIENEEGATDNNDQDDDGDDDKVRIIINSLEKQLDRTHESVIAALDKVMEICAKRRRDVDELKKRINTELEQHFTQEDARLQEAVNLVRKNIGNENPEEAEKAVSKARGALVLDQKYTLSRPENDCSLDDYGITAMRDISLSYLKCNERNPSSLAVSFTDNGEISLSFAFFSKEELAVLEPLNITVGVAIGIWEEGCEHLRKEVEAKYKVEDTSPVCFTAAVAPNTRYCLQVRLEYCGLPSGWSDTITFTTPDFRMCTWKKCPPNINIKRKYSVDEKNPRIASIAKEKYHELCTIVGTMPLPPNNVVSWGTKILKSKDNDGYLIYTGVASFDIDLDADNHHHYGWYFHCYDSTLHSGPPHNYYKKKYGPIRLFKRTVRTGDAIGATMDTTIGALSFSVNGRNYGVAYEWIPFDKPLVPCVLLKLGGDSVELIDLDVKKASSVVDSSIPVPPNITVKCELFWDSITLTWDKVVDASFYQIKVDGSKFLGASTTNAFTKRGLLPETEYNFRVRTVKGNSAGQWSDVVKGRTLKKSFEISAWKSCPDGVYDWRKYTVDEENPRITKINNYNWRAIAGNTHIPPNTVTSWSIKIIKSKKSNGCCISIGIAPNYIYQSVDYLKYGWYLYCYCSELWSGPPHNYSGKEYGPRKGSNGEYVQTGDSVGVIMDTTKGELSFVLDGVNYGVAYEGIPLDRPLVPCVILGLQGDSVELII